MYLKLLEKQEQYSPKSNERKDILEINALETPQKTNELAKQKIVL
jgi:hypothetical protein